MSPLAVCTVGPQLVLFGEIVEPLGGRAYLEEVCHGQETLCLQSNLTSYYLSASWSTEIKKPLQAASTTDLLMVCLFHTVA